MPLQLKDESSSQLILEISGGGALIGIDGAADSVHILAICGNPIIKANGLARDGTVVSLSAAPATGTVTLDGSGLATVTTSLGGKNCGRWGPRYHPFVEETMLIFRVAI